MYTTHTGLKPYEIVTTAPPRNQTATYIPPFIWDNEPLSCYPDYVLSETPPNFWGWAPGYDEGKLVFNNRCFTSKANGCKDWSGGMGCTVRPGEVRLLYFPTYAPEAHQTITEPPISTLYDKFYDFTLYCSSPNPLNYGITNTITAHIHLYTLYTPGSMHGLIVTAPPN